MTMPREIHHRDNCTQPDVRLRIGRHGDPLLRCNGCGRFITLDDVDEPADHPQPEPEAPTGYVARVCPTHYVPVNAKGRGCTECDAQRAMTKAQRRARRHWARTDRPER